MDAFACVAGVCVLSEDRPRDRVDAGADAGVDAGLDAGPDGGVDGGTIDAGDPRDGGLDDAGSDGGAEDGGPFDSGQSVDGGGTEDAGVTDPDAGPDTVCFGSPQVCAPRPQVVTVCTEPAAVGPCAEGSTAPTIAAAIDLNSIGGEPRFVFLPSGNHDESVTVSSTNPVTIVGEPGSVVIGGFSPAIRTEVGSELTVIGVSLQALGVVVSANGGLVTLVRSNIGPGTLGVLGEAVATVVIDGCTIHDNGADANASGGALLRGAARVENTVFANNGMDLQGNKGSGFGAVALEGDPASVVFRFNTLFGNLAVSNNVCGVVCSQPVLIDSVIEFDSDAPRISSTCVVKNSNVRGLSGADPNSGNIDADPAFTDAFGHLASTSPCLDQGTVESPPSHDIDGQVRPQGAAPDIGADEAR